MVKKSLLHNWVPFFLKRIVKEGKKRVEVDPLKSELFPSSETVKEHLVASAVSHIEKIVQKAVEGAEMWVPKVPDIPSPTQKEVNATLEQGTTNDSTIVDLGDGTVARLKM